ncbi:MAG: PspC domain-containing protein [Candidatus Gracilibacteria bacterium]|nr:PspC domain-containing protein [Candidatus Gracilibacteria bacterium]
MDKFKKYKLSLNEKQKDLVNNYLEKIKKFVDKHEIETELYNDIEEMVFEKLSNENEFTDLKIIKILKEVGEPEVIFSDYVQEKSSDNKEIKNTLFFEKLEKSAWIRDNEGAIFLGISKTLSEKIGISILAVRIILLILMFPLGLSIWLYILAGIILPLKGVDYSNDTVYSFFRKQIVYSVRNGVYNLTASFLKIFPFFVKKLFDLLKYILTFITKNIFPIFRFLIFGFVGVFLGFGVIGLLVALSFYFTNFSLENIDFLASIPYYFVYAILTGIYALSIFAFTSIAYGISKKIPNKYLISSSFVALLISIFLFVSTGLDLVQKYTGTNEFIQESSLNIGNTGSYILDLGNYNNGIADFSFGGTSSIKLVNSTGSELKLEVKNTVIGNGDIYKKYTDSFSPISLSNLDNNIKLSFSNNQIYAKKVPFAPINREFIIYIPQGVKLTLKNYYFYFENAITSNEFEKYSDFLNNNCRFKEVFFSQSQDNFVCNPSLDELINAKKSYYENYIINNFSDISPIKHEEKYKRDYYNNNNFVSDWSFRDFIWDENEENKLNFNFGDRSLDINSSLKLIETSTGILINDFIVNDVNFDDYVFEKKYYKDLEILNKFMDTE